VTATTTPVLSARGLDAGYDGVAVVRGVDIDVAPGEVVALLGPNGAGKTTTLCTLSGLLPRLAGTVEVLGTPSPASGRTRRTKQALDLVRRGVAHVPEDRGLFYGLTGRDHLRLASGRGGTNAIDAAVAPFPALASILDRRAGLMSGGEQQMLAIARGLATRPRLLMIDELSLGLAPIVIETILPLVREVATGQGVGVLLVEQHVNAALQVADRGYVMVRGSIVASGTAAELRDGIDEITRGYLGGAPE